jgi:GNAT superfamily N-acetyltransferase
VDIRPAHDHDLTEIARLRLAFLADVRGLESAARDPGLAEATTAFLERVTDEGRIRSWLAEDDGDAVGLVSVLVTDAPPLPEDHRSRAGYVVNLYVAPSHRRAGLAGRLVDEVLAAAGDLGLRSLHLYATEAGRPLYEREGFAPDDRFLARPIPPG